MWTIVGCFLLFIYLGSLFFGGPIIQLPNKSQGSLFLFINVWPWLGLA